MNNVDRVLIGVGFAVIALVTAFSPGGNLNKQPAAIALPTTPADVLGTMDILPNNLRNCMVEGRITMGAEKACEECRSTFDRIVFVRHPGESTEQAFFLDYVRKASHRWCEIIQNTEQRVRGAK